MSEAVTALSGAAFSGLVEVADAGLTGMVTLRGTLDDAGFGKAVNAVSGLDVPEQGGATVTGDWGLLWMSPDELMMLCPYDEAGAAAETLAGRLTGGHALAVNVSDARAVIRLTGEDAALREVLARLSPADLRPAALPVGRVRRTRVAQAAAAIWFEAPGEARVIAFRSVADYVFALLSGAARPGSETGHFRAPPAPEQNQKN